MLRRPERPRARSRVRTWRDVLASWLAPTPREPAPVPIPDLPDAERLERLAEIAHEDRSLIEALLA